MSCSVGSTGGKPVAASPVSLISLAPSLTWSQMARIGQDCRGRSNSHGAKGASKIHRREPWLRQVTDAAAIEATIDGIIAPDPDKVRDVAAKPISLAGSWPR